MKLLSVAYARTAIGEQDYADINTMIDSALKLITYPLESLLLTKFVYGTFKDVFLISTRNPVKSSGMVKLALSRGLVDMTTPPVIKTSMTLAGLATADVLDEEQVVAAANGLITIPTALSDCWLQVEYQAGIQGDDTSYEIEYVPEWLRDAAVVYTAAVYQRLVADKNRDSTKVQKEGVALTKLPVEVAMMLQDRIRWYPDAFQPHITV